MSGGKVGKLFHTLVAAAANVLSPKLLQPASLVDSERSSVSRTQFSGAYISDQLTVVDEVARSVTAQRLVDERRDLEHDVLPHREPVYCCHERVKATL